MPLQNNNILTVASNPCVTLYVKKIISKNYCIIWSKYFEEVIFPRSLKNKQMSVMLKKENTPGDIDHVYNVHSWEYDKP